MPSGVFDPRGAEAYSTVRRAPRGEKTLLGAVHRRPQQTVGEICRLESPPEIGAKGVAEMTDAPSERPVVLVRSGDHASEIGASVELTYRPYPGPYQGCLPADDDARSTFGNTFSYGL